MYKNVLEMYHDYVKGDTGRGGGGNSVAAREMKNIYTSFLNLNPEPILGHIAGFCEMYTNMIQENNLYKFLGVMNQNEMIKWALPVVWSVFPDEYTPKHITPHISSPSLSLYDYRFYVKDDILEKQMRGVRLNVSNTTVIRQDEAAQSGGGRGGGSISSGHSESNPVTKTIEYIEYKRRITRAFMKFIGEVFTKCLGHDYEKTHNIKAQDVYDIECLLMNLMNSIDTRFDANYANMYKTAKTPDIRPDRVKTKKSSSSFASQA